MINLNVQVCVLLRCSPPSAQSTLGSGLTSLLRGTYLGGARLVCSSLQATRRFADGVPFNPQRTELQLCDSRDLRRTERSSRSLS